MNASLKRLLSEGKYKIEIIYINLKSKYMYIK